MMVTALDAPYYAPAEAGDDSIFDRVMESNVKSVWMACQEGARAMHQRGGFDRRHQLGARGTRRTQRVALLRGQRRGGEPGARAGARMGARRKSVSTCSNAGWMAEEGSPALADDEFAANLLKYLPYKRLVKPEETGRRAALPGLAGVGLRYRRGDRDRRRPALPGMSAPERWSCHVAIIGLIERSWYERRAAKGRHRP